MKTVITRIAGSRRTQIAMAIAGLLVLSGMAALAARRGKTPADVAPRLVVALPVHSLADPQAGDPRYPAEAAARYSNSMSFRVGGKLIERRVRLGDTVRKGQMVARLDPVDAAKQAAAAQAALEAAEHRLKFTKQQLDRDMAQSAQNLISATQLEQTQDTYATALAGRDQAADQLAVARNTLGYQTLVADHDGVITSENADTEQVVTAGQPVYGLAWSGEVDAVLDVTASDVETISVGRYASVTFAALPHQRFDAHVREVSPSADPQSRTYRVKLTLSDPGRLVRLGMTGDAQITPPVAPTEDEHTFTVPATALFHRGQEPAVWVIRAQDSMLELRPVTVRRFGERQVVISTGLRDGDTVVQAGVHTVYAGEHVKAVAPLFAGEGTGALDADADPYAPSSAGAT